MPSSGTRDKKAGHNHQICRFEYIERADISLEGEAERRKPDIGCRYIHLSISKENIYALEQRKRADEPPMSCGERVLNVFKQLIFAFKEKIYAQ
jgi:hypothetical protein